MSVERLFPGRCYLCGDPCFDEWFCVAHQWAGGLRQGVDGNGLEHITREHAFWIERLTPVQIVELATFLEPVENGDRVPA